MKPGQVSDIYSNREVCIISIDVLNILDIFQKMSFRVYSPFYFYKSSRKKFLKIKFSNQHLFF